MCKTTRGTTGQRVGLCLGWGLGWSRLFCADEARVWSWNKQSQRVENELALLSFCGSEKSNEALYRLPPCVYIAVRGKSSQPYSSSSPHFRKHSFWNENRNDFETLCFCCNQLDLFWKVTLTRNLFSRFLSKINTVVHSHLLLVTHTCSILLFDSYVLFLNNFFYLLFY